MDDTPHLVAYFMAAGAEQRLDDYYYLRHTYDTISGQETQLNRILRMLGEDEIALNWFIDTTPIDRARSRSLYDFDRVGGARVLPGRLAYERLREIEREDVKRRPVPQVSSRRSYSSRPTTNGHDQAASSSDGNSNKSSAARLRALAEYEAELAEAEAKRRQAKQKEKSENIELIGFSIQYKDSPISSDEKTSLGSLLCEWTSPSSSSNVNYFTIERQLDGQEWLLVEKLTDKSQNQIQLDISSLLLEEKNANLPSRFRLSAHLEGGKVVASQPTDQINLSSLIGKRLIIPNIEILSNDSARLIWANDESDNGQNYDIEKREGPGTEWTKVSKVSLEQGSAQVDNLQEIGKCQFRMVPSSAGKEEAEVLTVHNVNEWLSSLRLVPTSSNTVEVDISEEGFKEFDRYKVEYTTIDQPDQWQQVSDITNDVPHLAINNLKQGVDYKFRLTPVLRGTSSSADDTTSSQLSLVLDVKMPSTRKGKLVKNEGKTASVPPQFAIHQTDPTSILIEAIIPTDKPASFEDLFDVYSKKETDDDQWTKIGTIDKDHLNLTMKNLSENTLYAFKIINESSLDEENNVIQQFNFEIASVNAYDPSLFLEKIEQSLENVVNGVMRAAAGHQILEDPLNVSLSEVIKEIFHDEKLVPNEQYGFDTLALSNDLQLFRGPKQMMLQELEVNETSESSKKDGEIVIHNYRRKDREQQPVIVREENGNTRIGNIDGDVIVRNVVSDVLLTNEETRNQLSMNIVGQAFLKGVQGVLIASKFQGIIVVKNVVKPLEE